MKTKYETIKAHGEIRYSLTIYPLAQDNVFIRLTKREFVNRKRGKWEESRMYLCQPVWNMSIQEGRSFSSALNEICTIGARWDASPEDIAKEYAE